MLGAGTLGLFRGVAYYSDHDTSRKSKGKGEARQEQHLFASPRPCPIARHHRHLPSVTGLASPFCLSIAVALFSLPCRRCSPWFKFLFSDTPSLTSPQPHPQNLPLLQTLPSAHRLPFALPLAILLGLLSFIPLALFRPVSRMTRSPSAAPSYIASHITDTAAARHGPLSPLSQPTQTSGNFSFASVCL